MWYGTNRVRSRCNQGYPFGRPLRFPLFFCLALCLKMDFIPAKCIGIWSKTSQFPNLHTSPSSHIQKGLSWMNYSKVKLAEHHWYQMFGTYLEPTISAEAMLGTEQFFGLTQCLSVQWLYMSFLPGDKDGTRGKRLLVSAICSHILLSLCLAMANVTWQQIHNKLPTKTITFSLLPRMFEWIWHILGMLNPKMAMVLPSWF